MSEMVDKAFGKPSLWSWLALLLIAAFSIGAAVEGDIWLAAVYAFFSGMVLATNLIFLFLVHPLGELVEDMLNDMETMPEDL